MDVQAFVQTIKGMDWRVDMIQSAEEAKEQLKRHPNECNCEMGIVIKMISIPVETFNKLEALVVSHFEMGTRR